MPDPILTSQREVHFTTAILGGKPAFKYCVSVQGFGARCLVQHPEQHPVLWCTSKNTTRAPVHQRKIFENWVVLKSGEHRIFCRAPMPWGAGGLSNLRLQIPSLSPEPRATSQQWTAPYCTCYIRPWWSLMRRVGQGYQGLVGPLNS